MEIDKITCVGVGTIGHSWATLFAWKGLNVVIYDTEKDKIERALTNIRSNLEFLFSHGLISKEIIKNVLDNIDVASTLENAVTDVEYIQESAYESYPVKKDLFNKIEEATSTNTIIATSSSGLLMSEIQKSTVTPSRCIVAHPWNPPHLIPLVEIVPGKLTTQETVQKTYSLMERVDKIPVVLRKEIPGHIANRLQVAVWRETLDLVDRGVASLEDVEKALSAGPGLRWAFMGSTLTLHLGGGEKGIEYLIEHLGGTYSEYWKDMARWDSIPPSAAKKAIQEITEIEPVKTKNYKDLIHWRDKILIQLLKLLHSQ